MEPEPSFARLLDHELWAAAGVARSLSVAQVPDLARARFAHLAGTHATWLARAHGRPATLKVWPELAVVDALACLRDSIQAWRQLVDAPGELERRAEYVNTAGESWSNTVGEMLTHVLLHSAYHRGQIASDLRRAGLEPVNSDYIQAVRTGKLPSQVRAAPSGPD